MPECTEIQDMLYGYAAETCDAETAKSVESHVAQCSHCSAELQNMREVLQLTGMMKKIKPSHDLYPGIKSRMRPHFFWLKVASAAAAAAVLMIVLLQGITDPYIPSEIEESKPLATVPKKEKGTQIADKTPKTPQELPETNNDVPSPEENLPSKDMLAAQKKSQSEPDKGQHIIKEEKKEIAQGPIQVPQPQPVTPDNLQKEPEKPLILATIGQMTGEVKVRRKGSEEWLETGLLFSIQPGDIVATNSLGKARLDLPGGDYIYLNSNAQVTVTKDDDITVKMEKGEVYLEKDTDDGTMAIDTGFGHIRLRCGRVGAKMTSRNKCLVNVISGEVECCGIEKEICGRYTDMTRAWFQKGRHCQKGTKLRSDEPVRWAAKLQPEKKQEAGHEEPDKSGKKDGQAGPPGIPPKPGVPGQQKPGQNGNGKVGPGPSPMPPPPDGDGQHGPGGKGHGPGMQSGGSGCCPQNTGK